MKPFWHVIACIALPLLAACDRNLYLGRDVPRAEDSDASTAAPREPLDAGAPAQVEPVVAPAQPEIMTPVAPICEAGHADCDLDVANGCEVDLMRNRDHCGSCSTACHTPDCSCNAGQLVLQCDAKHADCDADMSNGCETDLMTSMQHCGACHRTCHANGHDATSATCTDGRCQVVCAERISFEEDCDGNPDNGCETYLMFDANNCGACGHSCAACNAGMCAP